MPTLLKNRQIHLVSRPKGLPSPENFQLSVSHVPALHKQEILVKVLYLSVDPYMRGRMGGRPSSHLPFPLNQPANGEGVGQVVQSNHPNYEAGDFVSGYFEWADYSITSTDQLWKFNPEEISPQSVLSVLGMPAMTAYFGLLDIGKPKEGETIVISAAAGAVGMIVGQIAQIKGARVIGITGSDDKVSYLLNELQFDGAVNYKKPDWTQSLHAACPEGLDIYYDNVGGAVTDEVMKLLNQHARIVLCGQIASYNLQEPDTGPRNFRHLIVKSAMAQGFLVNPDYKARFPEGRYQLLEWLKQKKIKPCETITHGLENLPQAFLGLFSGENLGKQLVEI